MCVCVFTNIKDNYEFINWDDGLFKSFVVVVVVVVFILELSSYLIGLICCLTICCSSSTNVNELVVYLRFFGGAELFGDWDFKLRYCCCCCCCCCWMSSNGLPSTCKIASTIVFKFFLDIFSFNCLWTGDNEFVSGL